MRRLLFILYLLFSLCSVGQYPTDSIVKKHRIHRVVITPTTPYQKSLKEYVYDREGKQMVYRETDFNTENKFLSQTWEWKSLYRDTFLVKQFLKVYTARGNVVNSGEVLYGYANQNPFQRLWRSEKRATGEKEVEQYFYNHQGNLDSICFLSKDSSISNGIRHSGANLFYKEARLYKTLKYWHDQNGLLRQSAECSNYYRPLRSLDSAGCIRINYTMQDDTLVQEVVQSNFQARKLTYSIKQYLQDGWRRVKR